MLFEASWALSWSNFSRFGHYVGSSWPLLQHLGAKMANKMGQDGERERQDEPRWANLGGKRHWDTIDTVCPGPAERTVKAP